MLHDIEAGYSFSTALSKYPDVFNRIFVNAVRAGEATGKLEEVLLQLADTLEKDQNLSAKIKGALFYPAFILTAMVGVGAFMMVKVIPTLTGIFKEAGADLPVATRMLIWTSDFMIQRWYLVIIIIVALVVLIRAFVQTPQGMLFMSKVQLKMPIFKTMSIQSIMARFSRLLGMRKENKEYSHKSALVAGAMTFFLPCGFTQAMQLYAVSTGSITKGALIMMLFALGTAPGLLGVGGLSSVFKGQKAKLFFMASGIAVIILGIFNISNASKLVFTPGVKV